MCSLRLADLLLHIQFRFQLTNNCLIDFEKEKHHFRLETEINY